MPEAATPDQERGESLNPPSTSHNRHTQPHPHVQCFFAYQHLDGCSCLVDIELRKNPEGGLVFNNAGPHISRSLSERWHCKILSKLFIKTIVGTSEVQQVLLSKAPTSSSVSRVYLQAFTKDPLLTEAYHDPNIVFYDPDSNSRDHLFSIAFAKQHQDLNGHRIVVIKRTVDKNKVAILLALLLIISPTLGIVVGLCFHKAELGVAVSAGVFALASFIQGLIAWVQE